MQTKAIIQTKDLKFAHDSANQWQFSDIELSKGDNLLILGGSGSGKTTLLHLLSGLLSPSGGSIWIDGKDAAALSKSALDDLRGSKIGMVFQRPHFIRSLNVIENIKLANKIGSNSSAFNVEPILKTLHIDHLAKNKITTLSEGEKQRVSIARALANNPVVILADEPTSALDDKNCDAVIKLLIDVSKENNCSLIVVTHDARIKPYFQNQMTVTSI